MAVGGRELEELYFRTTLELRDDSGVLFRITPTEHSNDSTKVADVLSPFTEAFILTAENPESSGEYSDQENARATAELGDLLASSTLTYRECPGFAWDSDHVEPGFAVLGRAEEASELLRVTLELATRFRQNAIFRLSEAGLSLVGALRPDLSGIRPVIVERA